MSLFVCEICRESTIADSEPGICNNCGTVNGPWILSVDGLTRTTLSSGDSRYIIFNDCDITRNILKSFFIGVVDTDGEPIYRYCDPDKVMLRFTKNSEGALEVSAPDDTFNYFTLNDIRLDAAKVKLKVGFKLNLFSVHLGKEVAEFIIS